MAEVATYTEWSTLFAEIDPRAWAYFGIAIALGTSILGAAW